MQRPIPILPPAPTLNRMKDAADVEAIDYTADFENLFGRFDAYTKFYNTSKTKNDLVRYIPGLTKPAHQGQIDGMLTKNAYVDNTYKGLKVAEFNIKLTNNQYMNFYNVYLVCPMKILKSSNVANDLADNVITVNNFFAHWIKELDTKSYGDDIPTLMLTNTVEIYKYSNAILKNIEGDALKIFQNDLLYSNKKVSLSTGQARQKHYTTQNADAANRTDNNLDDRLDKFSDQLQDEYCYMILLRFLCNLGLVNQPVKFNTKWFITFEQDYEKLFETKGYQAQDALPTSVDAKIILTATPYLIFEQFKLDDNYRAYLEWIIISNKFLRTGIKKTPYQKTYELIVGAQSRAITFELSNKQFFSLESSLVVDSSHSVNQYMIVIMLKMLQQ